jgi:hypothetical protein
MRSTKLQHLLVSPALVVLTIVAALAFPLNVGAVVLHWTAHLDESQEVPPTGSPSTGEATGTLDTETNELSWEVEFKDLSGPATGAHFHGPAPVGVNAGILIDIGAISGLTPPLVGSKIITDEQKGFLCDGLLYINIHSAKFPSGEIRGQVNIAEPPGSMEGTVWTALVLAFDSNTGDFLYWFTDVFRFDCGTFTADGLGSAPYAQNMGPIFTMWNSKVTIAPDSWTFSGRRKDDGNLTFGKIDSTVGLFFKFIAVLTSDSEESSATAADWGK